MRNAGHSGELGRVLTAQVCCTDGFTSSRVRMNGLNNAITTVPFLADSIAEACPHLIIRVFGEEVCMSALSPFLSTDDTAVNANILRIACTAIKLCRLAPGPFATWCLLKTSRVRAIVVLDYYHLSGDKMWGIQDEPVLASGLLSRVFSHTSERRLSHLTADLWTLGELHSQAKVGGGGMRRTVGSSGDVNSIQELENRFARLSSSNSFPFLGLRELFAALCDVPEREVSISGGEHPALSALLARLIQDVELIREFDGGMSMIRPTSLNRLMELIK